MYDHVEPPWETNTKEKNAKLDGVGGCPMVFASNTAD
jgi:hypothetical protein